MPCAGCGGVRSQIYSSARAGDYRGVSQAVFRGATIIRQKMAGTYDDAQYQRDNAPPATPYRRPSDPIERSK